jgi:hypothetical protein
MKLEQIDKDENEKQINKPTIYLSTHTNSTSADERRGRSKRHQLIHCALRDIDQCILRVQGQAHEVALEGERNEVLGQLESQKDWPMMTENRSRTFEE